MKDVAVSSVFIGDLCSVLFCFYPAAFRLVFNLNITVQLQKRYKGKKCPENIASATIFISLPTFLPQALICVKLEKLWFSAKCSENPRFWKVWVHLFTILRGIKCAGWRQEKRKIENTTALMRQKGAKAIKNWEITRAQTNFKTTTTINRQKETPSDHSKTFLSNASLPLVRE